MAGAKTPTSTGFPFFFTKKPLSKPIVKPNPKAAWSDNIARPDKYGFFKFKNVSKHTLVESDYAAIIENDERWHDLTERMDADFLDELDMFPFGEHTADEAPHRLNWLERLNRLRGAMVRYFVKTFDLTRVELPQRFHLIQRALIERRFPGGRATGEPGDGDIRDMLSEFREMYEGNLARSISKKRSLQFHAFFVFALIVFAILAFRASLTQLLGLVLRQVPLIGQSAFVQSHMGVFAGIVSILTFVAIWWLTFKIYRLESEYAFNAYNNAQTESCKTLDKLVALRTKNLSNLVSTLTPRIDQDRAMLNASGRRNEWPERSRKWVKLVYWLGKRQEALERFAQTEIWSIRRTHYFYNIAGSVLSLSVVGLSIFTAIAMGIAAFMINDYLSGGRLSMMDIIVFQVGSGLVALLINRLGVYTKQYWNTPLNLIEENLDVKNWDRLHSVRLQDRLAEQVFKDKQSILHHEEMVTGKNR